MALGKTEKIYQDCLKKIKKEKLFDRSPIYYDLLSYLIEATLKNEQPKEVTIAADVFNKSPSSEKETSIRPYISNLRKKLVEYSQDAGSKDEFHLVIPKGRYTIQYVANKRDVLNTKTFFFVALAIISILLVLFFSLRPIQKNSAFHSIWDGFLANEKKPF